MECEIMAKCEHGSYIPEGHTVAVYCRFCNPAGVADGPTPILPKSSGDALNIKRTDSRGSCASCGCIRVYSMTKCPNPKCGADYPTDKATREQLVANAKQEGSCPECGSTVHYESKDGWECCDCGKTYPAPKRLREEAPVVAPEAECEDEVPVEN